ncbi:hypothetical protein MRB53_001959 [Persea americana]|uniref:Uncharacterized protein n=1 Tax=Persea americana TaxID=3435 RepID=A0ACC2MU28_PERAE|nr:hypothetical protein MRB53_001959 [Persea americana]
MRVRILSATARGPPSDRQNSLRLQKSTCPRLADWAAGLILGDGSVSLLRCRLHQRRPVKLVPCNRLLLLEIFADSSCNLNALLLREHYNQEIPDLLRFFFSFRQDPLCRVSFFNSFDG